ncbi:hypothetical protein KW791_02140, partial [Candidatus Parcubacteria bacterium]|nr:hypothetical protein [Candidatus Parcubacteria bacterium]
MPQPLSEALFDIKPVDESGNVDVQKIGQVDQIINLSGYRPQKLSSEVPIAILNKKPTPYFPALPNLAQDEMQRNVEYHLNQDLDVEAELAQIGASLPGTREAAKP